MVIFPGIYPGHWCKKATSSQVSFTSIHTHKKQTPKPHTEQQQRKANKPARLRIFSLRLQATAIQKCSIHLLTIRNVKADITEPQIWLLKVINYELIHNYINRYNSRDNSLAWDLQHFWGINNKTIYNPECKFWTSTSSNAPIINAH